jgi:hypothetical protein
MPANCETPVTLGHRDADVGLVILDAVAVKRELR